MAVFCDVTGKRIAAPNGEAKEYEDAEAYKAKHNRAPRCKDEDPEDGWDECDPPAPKPSLAEQIAAKLTMTPEPVVDCGPPEDAPEPFEDEELED